MSEISLEPIVQARDFRHRPLDNARLPDLSTSGDGDENSLR